MRREKFLEAQKIRSIFVKTTYYVTNFEVPVGLEN